MSQGWKGGLLTWGAPWLPGCKNPGLLENIYRVGAVGEIYLTRMNSIYLTQVRYTDPNLKRR